jgi:hypothetical protein
MTEADRLRMTISPYKKRPIRFLEEWRNGGWRLKVYAE